MQGLFALGFHNVTESGCVCFCKDCLGCRLASPHLAEINTSYKPPSLIKQQSQPSLRHVL